MPWARIVAGIGRTMITTGLLILLFVAYQLWGTGLAEARAQEDLRESFQASLAATTPATSAPTTTTTSTTSTTTPPGATPTTAAPEQPVTTTTTAAPPAPRPPTPRGEAVAIIRIPRIGVDKAVVEGVTLGDLKKGPGHYPSSPLPGRPGNSAIAGHRTTYGAPFGDLGSLRRGDEILVTTRDGDFRYVVDRISIVSPDQVEVLDQTEEARLTLTTCHPKYSARQRLVVSGVLSGEPLPPPTTAPPTTGPPATDDGAAPQDPAPLADDPVVEQPATTLPAQDPAEESVVEEPATTLPSQDPAEDPALAQAPQSIDDPSLAGNPEARGPAAGWAAATALIALGAWLVGRRWRRWPSYGLALPLGAVTLFQCFEQITRMLPANI